MGEKIVVGPFNRGFRNDVTPFNVDNDSFPTLINAYQWRGRVKRKRGTAFLTHLRRAFSQASIGVSQASPWTINTIYSTYVPPVTPEPNSSVVPGSVRISILTTPILSFVDQGDGTLAGFKVGTITFATQANPCQITSAGHTLSTGDTVTISGVLGMTQLNGNTYTITVTGVNTFTLNGVDSTGFGAYTGGGTWISPSAANFGTINYLTGVIVLTHTAGPGVPSVAFFSYFPNLPVMGLEDFTPVPTQFPLTIGFDTKYSYNINTFFPYDNYDVSYYKNPGPNPTTFPGYNPKTTWTRTTWNGENYQQFWTTNYQGALWATNGIKIPFKTTNIGMQFKPIVDITTTAGAPIPAGGVGTPAIVRIFIIGHGLVQGDFLFINEVVGTTGINLQTGYVISADPQNPNFVDVEFPFADIRGPYVSGGIAQYLTNRSDPTIDSLRWYDGDPTDGNVLNPGFVQGKGWVNFAPPLNVITAFPQFSIADLPPAQYYLVGARMIVPFKDRLLFLGPVVQTAAPGSQVYLQDTVIYSQNGTPYYTASYTNTPNPAIDTPTSATNIFHPILVPDGQTGSPAAYFEDFTGFGGFVTAGVGQPLITVGSNEDALIMGFSSLQARFIASGDGIIPFNFFVINSELGSGSTFSVINMDQGVITRGERGFVITGQTQTQRMDLEIPDEVFQVRLIDNGPERVCSQRDFINEWVYFTYPVNFTGDVDPSKDIFPSQSLLYNYRDQSWAIFRESYTHYGQFKKRTGFTWSTVGREYATWEEWDDPWNAGESTLLQPLVIAGNQQGFVLVRDTGTGEGTSLFIQNIVGNIVTSPDHGLNNTDFIIINGALGSVGQQVNGRTFQVFNVTQNTFQLDPPITAATYIGAGLITRIYRPQIQSRQFPPSWGMSRKTRLGPQQYLLTTTQNSQIQLLIFLSENTSSPYNDGPIIPATGSDNNGLIYSTVLFTCPESTNLGLTPANINLQMVTAQQQAQIWHRINTSLLGDTVQVGFTMSDEQLSSLIISGKPFVITGVSTTNPAVLLTTGQFSLGQLIQIQGVLGMTQLNGNIYNVISSTPTTVTIEVDATAFTPYMSGGTATLVSNVNQFAEIELHGFILDINQSSLLA